LQKPARTFFRERPKFIRAGCSRCLHCRLNPTSALCNLFISLATGAGFEVVKPITGENQMGMRVNETRQNNATRSIDDFSIVSQIAFDFFRSSDRRDQAVPHQHSTLWDDRKITKLRTDSWSLRTCERNKLRSVEKSERFQFFGFK
jgi:hypothetical protein